MINWILKTLGVSKLQLIVVGVLVLSLMGAVAYAKYVAAQNDKLEAQMMVKDIQITSLNNTIDRLELDKVERKQLHAEMKTMTTDLIKELSNDRKGSKELADKYSRHNMGLLVANRPGDITRYVNNGTQQLWLDFEQAANH
jgi:hypothetical protein